MRTESDPRIRPEFYAAIVTGVSNAEPGKTTYVWDPDKGSEFSPWWEFLTKDSGWEIASWTTAIVNKGTLKEQIWMIGLSTMLAEVMRQNGTYTHIHTSILVMAVTTMGAVFFLLFLWRHDKSRQVVELQRTNKQLTNAYNLTKQAEECLRQSEEKYRILVEHAGELIFVTQDGILKFANPKCTEILGYDNDELLNQTFGRFIHPEDRSMVIDRHWKRQAGAEVPTQYSFRVQNHRGQALWLELNVVPISWEGRVATLNFAKDVTPRRQWEKALAERDRLLQGLAKGLIVLLGGGHSDRALNNALECLGIIMNVSRVYIFENHPRTGAEQVACSQRFEWVNKGISPQIANEELQNLPYDALPEFIYQMLSQGRPVQNPLSDYDSLSRELLNAQGIQALLLMPIQVDKQFWGFIGFDDCQQDREWQASEIHVLTMAAAAFGAVFHQRWTALEKETLQAQFIQAQKMESIGKLAGGVAHDFNNMLGVITGFVELALLKTPDDDPRHKNLLEVINAAKRSADLVRQLLAFARKQTASPGIVDLNQAVYGMHNMLKHMIGEDIDLVFNPGEDLWFVYLDASHLDQIVVNLVVNSRDAIPGRGAITLSTSNVTLDTAFCLTQPKAHAGEYVLLTVTDTGNGMKADIMEKVFDPFFTTKEPGRGTGLGLATIYGIVHQNNGFILLESAEGQGTTFQIFFPRHTEMVQREETGVLEQKQTGGSETILIVEDEESIMEMMKLILEQQGYNVLTALSPVDAVDLSSIYSGKIHLLFTDVVMPEMNGRELLEQLQQTRPDMRCLFMSGYTSDIVANQGVIERGERFLQKPFSLGSLVAKVREALDE